MTTLINFTTSAKISISAKELCEELDKAQRTELLKALLSNHNEESEDVFDALYTLNQKDLINLCALCIHFVFKRDLYFKDVFKHTRKDILSEIKNTIDTMSKRS